MRIVGLDPGLGWTGFGVLDCGEGATQVVDASAFKSDPDATIAARARELASDVSHLIAEHKPAAVVVETPSFGIAQASAVAMLWAAYGVILGASSAMGPLVVDRQSDAWRAALGLPTGRQLAKARQLTAGARRTEHKRLTRALVLGRFPGLPTLLATQDAKAASHAFDALAIALSFVESANFSAAARRGKDASA